MGSGVIIDPAGLILTVNYVVMGGETIQVSFSKGRSQRAELVAQDFELGLALLKVKRANLPAVPVASSEHLDRGAAVFALASTGPRERRVSGGLLTYLGEFEAYWEYLLERSLVSSAANPGSGGGPLFTMTGQRWAWSTSTWVRSSARRWPSPASATWRTARSTCGTGARSADRSGRGWASSRTRSTRASWWRDWCPMGRARARASARATSSCRSTRSRCRRGRSCTCRSGGGVRESESRSR